MKESIQKHIENHILFAQQCRTQSAGIEQAALAIINALQQNNTVYFMGNGGSAADSQHLAAELVGRFKKDRRAYKAIALTTDTSVLTSIANDYSFDSIFIRQLQGLAQSGDIVVALSTSGNSKNVINAVEFAKTQGITVIGLLGKDGGILQNLCDIAITIPSPQSDRTQEMHILIGHIICELVEDALQ